jgi:hypothetical protein
MYMGWSSDADGRVLVKVSNAETLPKSFKLKTQFKGPRGGDHYLKSTYVLISEGYPLPTIEDAEKFARFYYSQYDTVILRWEYKTGTTRAYYVFGVSHEELARRAKPGWEVM